MLRGNYAQDVREARRAQDLGGSGGGIGLGWDARAAEKHEDNLDDALEVLYQRSGGFGGAKASQSEEGKREPRVDLERVSQRLLLERQDLEEKIKQTRREFRKLARRKLVLEDEWKKLNVDRADLDEDKRRFASARRSPWFQSTLLPTSELRRVRISVGGQLFETTEQVLKRDPGSLLAALVGSDSPIQPDDRGCFIIDRDWVLFRHILAFLRDGALPQAPDAAGDQLIARLYKEADFYRLETLRCAIREFLDPFQLVERAAAVPLSRLHKIERQMESSLQHLNLGEDPYLSGERYVDDDLDVGGKGSSASKDGDAVNDERNKNDDWWTSSRYKGRDFRANPPDVDEANPWRKRGSSATTRPEDFLREPTLASTWRRPSSPTSPPSLSPRSSTSSQRPASQRSKDRGFWR